MKKIEQAFKANQRSAAAANALCELFIRKGNHPRVREPCSALSPAKHQSSFVQALKLAERTIQFADTLTILTDGYIRAGRVSHAEGSLVQASKYYLAATEGQPKHILGAIGLAQMQIHNGVVNPPIQSRTLLTNLPQKTN